MSNQISSSDSIHVQVDNYKYRMKGKHPYNNSAISSEVKIVGRLSG